MHGARKTFRIFHQIVMLGARAGNAGGVGFLKRIIADQMGRHLTGQADNWNRVHQRIGKARYGIGCPRSAGYKHNADLTGRAGVTFSSVDSSLFMAHENVTDSVLFKNLVI